MSGVDPKRLAVLLRQRRELGADDLFLDDTDPDNLRRAVEALGKAMAADDAAGDSVDQGAPAPLRPVEPAPRGRPDAVVRDASPESGGDSTDSDPDTLAASARTDAVTTGKAAENGAPSTPSFTPPDTTDLDYDALRELAMGCTRCGLAETRTNVVFSDGNPGAELVVVGEAPGANEDRTGLPFVGAAGKLLDLMLASVDLSREESVYICNVLKCRPPGNRNPEEAEIRTCSPFLHRQLQLVKPRALLAVGSFAAQLLTGKNSALGKLRGQVYSYEGIPLVVTYHPAALLRNSGWARPTWDDLQLLRQIMDGN